MPARCVLRVDLVEPRGEGGRGLRAREANSGCHALPLGEDLPRRTRACDSRQSSASRICAMQHACLGAGGLL